MICQRLNFKALSAGHWPELLVRLLCPIWLHLLVLVVFFLLVWKEAYSGESKCVTVWASYTLSIWFSSQLVHSMYSPEAQKTLDLLQNKNMSNITVYYQIQKAIDLWTRLDEPFYSQCLFIIYSDNWCSVWSPQSAQKHLQFQWHSKLFLKKNVLLCPHNRENMQPLFP